MARTRTGTPPAYPPTPHDARARIMVRLVDGRRHALYLGKHGSLASYEEYARAEAARGQPRPVSCCRRCDNRSRRADSD
jgi:hypothetical protein